MSRMICEVCGEDKDWGSGVGGVCRECYDAEIERSEKINLEAVEREKREREEQKRLTREKLEKIPVFKCSKVIDIENL